VKTLVLGVGNPGRRDDGLGPALVERLAGSRPPERAVVGIFGGSAEAFWAYQLNIEDAACVRDYDRIVFADAAEEAASPVELRPLTPAATIAFTTHELAPASVLALGEDLYGRRADGFLLAIRGSEWDFAEGLSAGAARNLAEAERRLRDFFGGFRSPD
jgi:hydrogenase maturation protease